jgi:PAS domain S-box-containing protein
MEAGMPSEHQLRQQRIFTTLVKGTNVLLISSAIINVFWLNVDFLGTLLQEMIVLAAVAVGWWCLRLARRGQMARAVGLYVSTAMALMAVAILTLGQRSIVNGALGLALFVLVASYLDPQDRTLRWGAVSIAVWMGALTLRIFGPFGGAAFTPADIAALYIFPVAGLLAFTLLGHNATGQLNEALHTNETARRELERSNQELQNAQVALKAANEQLGFELAERQQAEEALHASLEQTARAQRLLLALGQAAQAVQQARTPEEIFCTIRDEVKALGHDVVVLQPSDDGAQLQVSYLSFDADQVAEAERLVGFSLLGYQFPRVPGSLTQKPLDSGETVLSTQLDAPVAKGLPPSLRSKAGQLAALLGMERAIIAPLTLDHDEHGLLMVTGAGLTEADKPAISTFANQAAIALSNARLFQKARSWAAELDGRVQSRTADLAASEARYRRLFDSNRDALYVLDMSGRFIDANRAGGQLLGYSREELLALDFFQASARMQDLSPENRVQVLEEWQTVWHQGLSGEEIELAHRTGAPVPVEVSATALTYQGQEAILCTVRDTTERKQAEEALRRSREEALRNNRLLLALSEAAQAVQRASTPEQVYQTIGDELSRIGYRAFVFTLSEDRSYAVIAHTTLESKLLQAAERLSGLSVKNARVRLAPDAFLQQIIAEGRSAFSPQLATRIASGVPKLGRSLIQRLIGMFDIERAVYAPLRVGGEVSELLVVVGSDLTEADVPAIEVLANQAGIALENAQLLAQLRASGERQQRLARQVVSAQEEERQRISLALHDEAGQALTALKINLDLIAQDLPPEHETIRKRLANAATMTDATMEEIRQLAQDLRPPALDAVGLNPTLAGFCQDFGRRTRLAIEYQGTDLPMLPEPANITLYRFLQEALTNVARHAHAQRARVALRHDAEAVHLSVEDDGHGFDAQTWLSTPNGRAGIGLTGMWERLESLGGRLAIESEPGQSTRLTAYIPLPETSLEA